MAHEWCSAGPLDPAASPDPDGCGQSDSVGSFVGHSLRCHHCRAGRVDAPQATGSWGASSRRRTSAMSLCLAALVAGPIAALSPANLPDDGMAFVVFRSGLSFADILSAVDAVEGRLVWTDEKGGVWLIEVGSGARVSSLYRHGALLVSRGPVAVGCLNWTDVQT